MELIDQYLRKVNYLRVSVTDRCDLRCVYCMKEKMQFLPRSEVLTLEEIENNLMTKGIPNPDLIIRTSGEYRISNFLLWQSAYAEYEFVSCNWPDFNTSIYIEVLKNFENRDRRYGQINEY